jgi:hypothetical protein
MYACFARGHLLGSPDDASSKNSSANPRYAFRMKGELGWLWMSE